MSSVFPWSVVRGLAVAAVVGAALVPGAAFARQSSIVIDANSGDVVHQSQADAARFPASLTKVMTLYMLFEQIEAGRFTLASRLTVSAEAARQPPSKLGVRAGSTIAVRDAINALITRSANDVAVVIAENIAGTEEAFAERMTRRARQIGMSRTTFQNASGLPNSEQVTTARDMALLGRAIYERFPAYSRLFSQRSFAYNGRQVRNHNRLLGRVAFVDGIKTGYTRASGFNLITSARGNGRHLVAVVMGGRTGRARDAEMQRLVQRHLPQMATRRTDFSVAQRVRGRTPEAVVASSRQQAEEVEETVVAQAPTPPATRRAAPEQVAAARVPVERPRPQVASVPAPVAAPAAAPIQLTEVPAQRREISPTQAPVSATAAGPVMQWRTGAQPVRTEARAETRAEVAPAPAQPQRAAPAAAAPSAETGWVVQIAATNSESDAQRMLREAKESVGGRLGGARAVTEAVQRGSATLYRARFAGFPDRQRAEAACSALRRSEYQCMAIRM